MRTPITYLLPLTLCLCLAAPVQATTAEPKDPYHVMWTSKKGKAKCCNKSSKEKADKCASKLSGKGVTSVQVMSGKCAK